MAKKFATFLGAKTYNEIPALMAIPEKGKNGRVFVWCPYCKEWHIHYKPEDGLNSRFGFGHRCSHCHSESACLNKRGELIYSTRNSPLEDTGYFLKPIKLPLRINQIDEIIFKR